MDPLERINSNVAEILGLDRGQPIPDFCNSWDASWMLVRHAHSKQTEFSLFMMIYDRHPIFMCSFIKGMNQRTSTGDDPMIAAAKAFIMMFAPDDDGAIDKQ